MADGSAAHCGNDSAESDARAGRDGSSGAERRAAGGGAGSAAPRGGGAGKRR